MPACRPSNAATSASAPRVASRDVSVSAVSSGVIGVRRVRRTSPASISSFIAMIETPVSVSPERMDHWIGAAPRWRGSSDACTLMQPCGGRSRIDRRRIRPYAATTIRSGRQARSAGSTAGSRRRFGLEHGQSVGQRELLHGRGGSREAAPAWPIGLADDADHRIAPRDQRVEAGAREGGRAHEDDAPARSDDDPPRAGFARLSPDAPASAVARGRGRASGGRCGRGRACRRGGRSRAGGRRRAARRPRSRSRVPRGSRRGRGRAARAHLGGEVGNREAALLPRHLALALGDHRVDELQELAPGFRALVVHVEDDDPLRLRRPGSRPARCRARRTSSRPCPPPGAPTSPVMLVTSRAGCLSTASG